MEGASECPDQWKSVGCFSKSHFIYLDNEKIVFRRFQYDSRNQNLQLFVDSFNAEHLIKKLICFKGSPSWIGFIMANRKAYFKKICVLETRMSDFYKSRTTSLKVTSATK